MEVRLVVFHSNTLNELQLNTCLLKSREGQVKAEDRLIVDNTEAQ